MKSRLFLLLFLGCVSGSLVAAEQNPPRGERARIVTTAGERLTGRVVETTTDTIVLELEDESGSRSISKQEVSKVETRRERSKSGGAWHKAKWGALIGAVSGLSLGFQHEQVGEDGATVGEAMALGAWSGGLFGGLIGALVGASSPGEEWVEISGGVRPGRDKAFSLSVTLEF